MRYKNKFRWPTLDEAFSFVGVALAVLVIVFALWIIPSCVERYVESLSSAPVHPLKRR